MNRSVRWSLGGALAAAATAAVAALSQVPYTPEPGPEALLRLSWRARGERVEICRQLSAEELEALPRHMRQERICEGSTAQYRLRVEVDGERRVDEPVQGSGEPQVRPLYVYRELPLPPGTHRIGITFERVGPAEPEAEEHDDEAGEHDEEAEDQAETPDRRAREAAVPRHLELQRAVELRPREVLLVTYDAERRQLRQAAAVTPPGAHRRGSRP
jgi:hypothetical protein